jgi:hypothetical protein
MNKMFKLLVKEAVLEALNEFVNGGVATVEEGDNNSNNSNNSNETPSDINAGGKEEDESGKGGASEETSGGGTHNGGRPRPDAGVGVFSHR